MSVEMHMMESRSTYAIVHGGCRIRNVDNNGIIIKVRIIIQIEQLSSRPQNQPTQDAVRCLGEDAMRPAAVEEGHVQRGVVGAAHAQQPREPAVPQLPQQIRGQGGPLVHGSDQKAADKSREIGPRSWGSATEPGGRELHRETMRVALIFRPGSRLVFGKR